MTVNPRLLIVEDNEMLREDLCYSFSCPRAQFTELSGVPGFVVDSVGSASGVSRQLARAAAMGSPYDVMLLDLGLPEEDDSPDRPTRVGIRILNGLDPRACASVVVITAHHQLSAVLIEVIKTRAAYDFVTKPWDPENKNVYLSVARAYRRVQELRWLDLRRVRAEQWVVVQSLAQQADRIGKVFSGRIDRILTRAEAVAGLLRTAYQLDPERDRDDPVCAALGELRKAVFDARDDCAGARQLAGTEAEQVESVALEAILGEVARELHPGLVTSQLTFDSPGPGKHLVRTFPDDVRALVKELFFHAIESAAPQTHLTARVVAYEDTGKFDVVFIYRPPRPDTTTGHGRYSDEGRLAEGRDLALAVRLARQIGARIDLKPTETEMIVTLHLPATTHDQSPNRRS